MAEREVSYRQWSAGVEQNPFVVALPFKVPIRREVWLTAGVGVGKDGAFLCLETVSSDIGGSISSNFVGVSKVLSWREARDNCRANYYDLASIHTEGDNLAVSDACPDRSDGDDNKTRCWIGLNDVENEGVFVWSDGSDVDVDFFSEGEPNNAMMTGSGEDWVTMGTCWCGDPDGGMYGVAGWSDIGWAPSQISFVCAAAPPGSGFLAHSSASSSSDSTCWSSLPALVPSPHTISEESTDLSSQGETYFANRFCPGWSSFILPACDPDTNACEEASTGNVVFDGGDDMFDMGNLIVTNLMGDCANDPHNCALGSLTYRSGFEEVPTNCFGQGGHYQMQQSDAMWVFFTTNVHAGPIDFMIAGNLGSDGSGTVAEYAFDAAPHMGFVKRECGDADGDPSVNHMTIAAKADRRTAVTMLTARPVVATAPGPRPIWTMTLCLALRLARRSCTFSTAQRLARA